MIYKTKEQKLAVRRERERMRMINDPLFKVKEQSRKRLHDIMRNKGRNSSKSIELIGCIFGFLQLQLEERFKEGMNWDNYGKGGWYVDHIKPCASFNLLIPEELKACFHYTNLQPMWHKENSSKGSLFNNKRHKYADHVNSK